MSNTEEVKKPLTLEEEDALHRQQIEGNLEQLKTGGEVVRTVPKDEQEEDKTADPPLANEEGKDVKPEHPKEAITVGAATPTPPLKTSAPSSPTKNKEGQGGKKKGGGVSWVPTNKPVGSKKMFVRSKVATLFPQSHPGKNRETDQSASESSDNQEGKGAMITDKDLSVLGQKITSSKGVSETVNSICQKRGIEMKRQWVNDLDARRIGGALITEYIVDMFLSGVQIERAHSLTDKLEQSITLLSDQVSKLMGVTKSYQQENKNLQAAISRHENISKDYISKNESLLEDYRSSLLDSLAPDQEFRKKDKGKKPIVEEEAESEQEDPGEAVELSELDDEQLVMVFLEEIGAKIPNPEDRGIVIASVLSHWTREGVMDLLYSGNAAEMGRALKIEVKQAVDQYVDDGLPKASVSKQPEKAPTPPKSLPVNWYD